MRFRFVKTISVENHDGAVQCFQSGSEIDEKDLPAGTIGSLKSTKSIVQLDKNGQAPAKPAGRTPRIYGS